MAKHTLYKQTRIHNSTGENTQRSEHNVEEEKSYIYLRHAKAQHPSIIKILIELYVRAGP